LSSARSPFDGKIIAWNDLEINHLFVMGVFLEKTLNSNQNKIVYDDIYKSINWKAPTKES
jgi:hypothetical protein